MESQQNVTGNDNFKASDKKELEKEDNEKSSSKALVKYIYNGIGIKTCYAVLILCIMTQISRSFSEIWVAIW